MTWRRLVALSIVGAAMWVVLIGSASLVLAQESGWVLTYAEGSGDNGSGPQELTWTCPVSGTGAGTVLDSDPGNTLTDGTYTDLQVDSGCDPQVGQTIMWGFWSAEIVSVTDPTPTTTTTTSTTTVPPPTSTSPAWTSGDVESLVQSSATTAGALRVVGTLLVMMSVVGVWRAYRARQ